jgi:TonB family protein
MRIAQVPLGALLLLALSAAPSRAVDTKPHIDTSGVNMQPAYPASAYGTGERGAVVMAIAVTKEGKASRVRLIQTSGYNDIDSAAIAGVMGWKFIPATHDGVVAEGISTIKLVFQPPAPAPSANSASPPPQQPDVPAPKDFLPSQIDLDAERGKFADLVRPIPCANGRMDVTVAFQHVNGRAAFGDGDPAFAALQVSAGEDRAGVVVVDREAYSPPIEDFGFQRSFANGSDASWVTYAYFGRFGAPQTISIFWNAYGLVTGRLGGEQDHETQLPSQPTEVRLRASGMVSRFIEPQLICLPDAKIPGG